MADLHNLLGELEEDDASVFDDVSAQEPQEPFVETDNRREPEVPAVLAQAEREQFRPVPEDDDLSDVEKDMSGQDEDMLLDKTEDVDYAQLKRFWTQELNCPELMHYNAETVGLHMELLEGQEESIDKLLDQASSSGLNRSNRSDQNLTSLVASIYKMDSDRVRFMLTDVARTRLNKIEQHALHMRDMIDRMSEEEMSYLKQYGELLERHLRRSVLDHFPKDVWKKLDDPEMIDSPDLDEFVFCKVLETVEIDNSDKKAEQDDKDELIDNIQEHKEGACLIARYSAIQDLVLEGKIELLM